MAHEFKVGERVKPNANAPAGMLYRKGVVTGIFSSGSVMVKFDAALGQGLFKPHELDYLEERPHLEESA